MGRQEMKLRNKKTGEIIDANVKTIEYPNAPQGYPKHKLFNSLAELNAEWEDCDEPEVIYYLSWDGVVLHSADKTGWKNAKQIGNYFETEEEAEKAVEKLKAWKRLKDKITSIDRASFDTVGTVTLFVRYKGKDHEEVQDLLDLLFGGEE